jgi:hypothetical protein
MLLFATASTVVMAAGCRESGPPGPKAVGVTADPMTTAHEAMARHDYNAAIVSFTEVVTRRPDDVEAHYGLGVSASQLDRLGDAEREFRWVVAHGAPTAPEVAIAREWLASRTNSSAPSPQRAVVTASENAAEPNPEMATVSGRVTGPDGMNRRLQLLLKGVPGTAVKDEYRLLRTDEQGSFRFISVVPGDYMLTNPITAAMNWRLKVSLSRGERRVLDLSVANHVGVRDDFPEAGS